MVNLSLKHQKIMKTCNLYLGCIVFGMCFAVLGPTLLDLQQIINTDAEHIAFVYTARSIGYLVGSLCGGMAFDHIKSKQIILIVCTMFECVTILGIPWSRCFKVLTAIMVMNGMSMGAFDTSCNVYLLSLWGKESAPYYQALHFSFGLGGLISPLIAAPFLQNQDNFQSNESFPEHFQNTSDFSNVPETNDLRNNFTESFPTGIGFYDLPKVTYAFSIVGAFAFLVMVLLIAACIISPTDEDSAADETKKSMKKNPYFAAVTIGLTFILLFVETGTEIGFAQMITPYAVKGKLQLPVKTGSYMTSTFWAAFTVSRFVSVFLAIKVTNLFLIVYDLVITAIAAIVLMIFMSHAWALWLSSVLFGVGIASLYPAIVAWFGTYINVTNKIAGVFVCSAAFGELVIPFTISFYLDTKPEVFVYMLPASCLWSAIVIFILYLIFRKETRNSTDQTIPGTATVGI